MGGAGNVWLSSELWQIIRPSFERKGNVARGKNKEFTFFLNTSSSFDLRRQGVDVEQESEARPNNGA